MSLSLPTTDPRWATDETNNAEPLSGKKDTGIPNGSPSVSADLNWLFFTIYTWILYLKSCLTSVVTYTGSAWVPKTGGGTPALNADGDWTISGGVDLQCHLNLPVGSVVTAATFGYNRGGSGTVTILLGVRDLATGGAVVETSLVADASGAAYETTTVVDFGTPDSITIAANKAYYFIARLNNASQVWTGITSLTYQRATTP